MEILLLDNYDSFTYMLRDYIAQCCAVCKVLRNDEDLLYEAAAGCDALVLSPGPQTPTDAGRLMEVIARFVQVKPVLGICLGHQAIGEHFGAKLVKAALPKHGKVEVISHDQHALFDGVPQHFEATRYHSLLLQELPAELAVIARSAAGENMALAHRSLPVYGVQFHPESCMTAAGLGIIKNFVRLAKQYA